MNTKEEYAAPKKETEALKEEDRVLGKEDLDQVTGGTHGPPRRKGKPGPEKVE